MTEQVDTLTVLLLVVALALSAFFSSAETAFMSLQRIRLRHLERIGTRGAERVRRLVDHPDRTLITILIGNNLVNTAAAALGTVIVAGLVGIEAAVLIATVSITVLLLIVGEITPKTVALRHSELLAFVYALPLDILARLFSPVTWLLGHFSSLVARLTGGNRPSVLSQDEISTVITMGEEAGVLHREETKILRNVLQLENTQVRDVMVPRTQVVGVEASLSVEEIAHLLEDKGYTRLPVYEENLDSIVGIIHAKDVLVRQIRGDSRLAARAVMRPALFTPETKTVSSLLREMKEQNTQLAIVIDEYGGTSGIVTLEDLLEEIVGEITSEFGAERRLVQLRTENEIVVDSAITIDDLNEAFEVDLPLDEPRTLAGFIMQELGRIPQPGDHFRFGDVEIRVLSMSGRRIGRVKISKQTPPAHS